MIILSYNCRGLASRSKKSSIKRMVDIYGPSIILFQETMGLSENVKKVLEGFLPGWTFEAVDATGRSRGFGYWLVAEVDPV